MQFEGKRALITGAAQGIGKATALAFAKEGANLVLLDLNGSGAEAGASECAELWTRASWSWPAPMRVWCPTASSCPRLRSCLGLD